MTQIPKPAVRTQTQFMYRVAHPSTAATATYKGFKAPFAGIIDGVKYVNDTGLAADATNVFSGVVKNGATTIATLFDTDSDNAGAAALVQNVWVAGVLDATKQGFAPGDEIDLGLVKGGTQTLPTGALEIYGRWI